MWISADTTLLQISGVQKIASKGRATNKTIYEELGRSCSKQYRQINKYQ